MNRYQPVGWASGPGRWAERSTGGLSGLRADLRLHLADLREDLVAQLGRRVVAAAAALHQGLDGLLEAVLLEARRALVEMLLDRRAVVIGHLVVDVLVDPVEHRRTVGLVRMPAAHAVAAFPTSRVSPAGASPS